MKICHVSNDKRSTGASGGVAKFAWYLDKAIGCDIYTKEELAKAYHTEGKRYDIIIADGYHAGGMYQYGAKVISIIHGSIKEFAIRTDKEKDNIGPVLWQQHTWDDSRILKVAVSNSAKKYAEIHHKTKVDAVIYNGVDTELFKSVGDMAERNNIVIHAANDYNKDGLGKLDNIIKQSPDFDFQYLNANIGEEHIKIQRGTYVIQPSMYEGNSYFLLEAMASGLKVLGSRCGVLEDFIDSGKNFPYGKILDYKASAKEFSDALYSMRDMYYFLDNPRQWVLENASFEKFKKEWQYFINNI